MQLAGPLFFHDGIISVEEADGPGAYESKNRREGKHIIILRTGRTIHPGIQIGHGIVHLTAVTEDIVGPEYQFGLFLFTEFLTQFKVQTIIRPAGPLSLFCSNNKYKNSLLPQKNLSRKATCNWPLPSLRDSELYRWMNSGNGNSL